MRGNPTPSTALRPPAMLITRPEAQGERFAADVRARLGPDVPILLSPILRIVPRDAALDLRDAAGVILTSENAAVSLSGKRGVSGLTAYCVGDRTAKAARGLGLNALSAGGAADDLVAMIEAARPKGPLVFPRGAESRGRVAQRLAGAGIAVKEVITYDQVILPLSGECRRVLSLGSALVVPLFSPRSAQALGAALQGAAAPLHLASLSAAVDAAWSGPAPRSRRVAQTPTSEAMLTLLAAIYADCLP